MATVQASQFIGSKISLVTKVESRYEGILYALDLQDATISLAKVKSFGTEDRPTDRPVPPKDEVFEFIIFRGADIKSLDVVEPPKSVTNLSSGSGGGVPLNDPAIVEVSYYHTPSNGGGGHSTSAAASKSASAGVLSSLLAGGRSPNGGGGGRGSGGRRRKSGNDAGTQAGAQRRGRGKSGNRNKNNNQNNQNNGNASDSSQNGQGNGRGRRRAAPNSQNAGDAVAASAFFAQMQQAAPHAYFQPPPFMMRPPGGFRGSFRRGGRGRVFSRRGQQPQGIIEAQQPAKVTFDEPFDFEKSHEELIQTLAKLEIVEKAKAAAGMQNGDESGGAAGASAGDSEGDGENKENAAAGEPVIYYCKENFFDSISCEALKKQNQQGRNVRPDWRAEKKLNTETFGPAAGRGGGPRRRGGGGGGNNGGSSSFYYRNGYYRPNHNPYLAMMAAGSGGYDPGYFMPGNGGFGNYRRGGGGGGGGGGRGPSGRGFYRGGFYDNF